MCPRQLLHGDIGSGVIRVALRRPAAHACGAFLRFINYRLRLFSREERLLAVGNEVGAVVLDHLDGGGPARSFRFDARLGLVEPHRLDVRGDLALGDHADRLAAWPSLVEL